MTQPREPIFNIPAVVLAAAGWMVAIHAGRVLLLGIDSPADDEFLGWFAFLTERYESHRFGVSPFPSGPGVEIWTFATYAFLHVDLPHLAMNSLGFIAFATPVARRFGAVRFLLFFVATAVAGAFAFFVMHRQQSAALIGASAVVFGMIAATIRFAFQPDGPIALWRPKNDDAYRNPALPLLTALRNPRTLVLIAVWFGFTLMSGLVSIPQVNAGQTVAWDAHVGGFLAGLLLFSLFDPVQRPTPLVQGSDDLSQ